MSSSDTLAPGKWEAGLTHGMIAQVRNVGAARWVGAGQIAAPGLSQPANTSLARASAVVHMPQKPPHAAL